MTKTKYKYNIPSHKIFKSLKESLKEHDDDELLKCCEEHIRMYLVEQQVIEKKNDNVRWLTKNFTNT